MKKIFLLASIVVGLCSPALALQASGGGGDHAGNGGDICEKRIQNINADFATWFFSGGGLGLDLPSPITIESYKNKMLHYMKTAKVSCVAEKIYIGRAEKICKNVIDHSGAARITCNGERFLKLNSNDQYVLIHHEYAGLSGFEVNTGEASDYRISNQISEYLKDNPEKKLSVRSPAWDLYDPFDAKSCEGKPFTTETFKNKNITPPKSDMGNSYAATVWAQLGLTTRERRCTRDRGCNGWALTPNQYAIDGYLMQAPDRGEIVFALENRQLTVSFQTIRTGDKFGINVDCGSLKNFSGECTVYSSHTHATTTAKATFNENCARVIVYQREDVSTESRGQAWIEREMAFGGKY